MLLGAFAAANFARALETVLNIYEKVMNIKKARKDLENTGVDETFVDGLEEQAKAMTKREIEQFVTELVAEREKEQVGGEGVGSEQGDQEKAEERKRELRTGLEKQTMELARRVDLGYRVDLDAGALPPSEDTDESPERAEERAAVDGVLAARERLRALKLTGTPILGLPPPVEPNSEAASDDGA